MKTGLSIVLALLPLIAAIQLPHIPTTPQDAIAAAESFLRPSREPAAHLAPSAEVSLADIGSDGFMRITSTRHPKHSVRIKVTTGWCDPDVRSYSGYLDVARGDGKDLFFYFFESRGKPKEDPVIMWINGGPGCSSSLGLFMELGPCTIKDRPKTVNDTKINPYSWNERANIFFLDEPIGVGFSHSEHGQAVGTTEQAALDVRAFVQIFFDTFKEYQGREFHMAGESYGGRYLPVFASAVIDGNPDLISAGKKPINLRSVMIGNGITDAFSTAESYYPYQCQIQKGREAPVQSIGECVKLAESVPRCHEFARKGCLESHDYTACSMALGYCEEMLGESFLKAGVNPYDISKPCTLGELADSLCYPETKKIGHYLDLPDVRATLGVDRHRGNWSSCDSRIGIDFSISLDSTGKTWLYVANLLERGIRVLNYAGTYDFICNHIGNEMWMEKLQWSGKKGYNSQDLDDWTVDGKLAGSYKTYQNLSLLKVFYAGHMVPLDKPKEALAMLTSWLGRTSFSA